MFLFIHSIKCKVLAYYVYVNTSNAGCFYVFRNIFIFNLALSDFLLVAISIINISLCCPRHVSLQASSIPITVFDGLTRSWPLPDSWLACRSAALLLVQTLMRNICSVIKTFPCIAAFMSSLTIVCVALDRYCRESRDTHTSLKVSSIAGAVTVLHHILSTTSFFSI